VQATIMAFKKQGISVTRFDVPGKRTACLDDTGNSCFSLSAVQISIPTDKSKGMAQPSTVLYPHGPQQNEFLVWLWSSPDDVSELFGSNGGRGGNYLHAANVLVDCTACKADTRRRVKAALDTL
jgi:hypothetical protein